MSKGKTILLASIFSALMCACGILAIGYSPSENEELPILSYVILPIAFPVLIFGLLIAHRDMRQVPENSFVLTLWRWIFYITGTGIIVWLLVGMCAMDEGHYHCEFESGFMSDNDVRVPYVNRSVGVLLLIVFGLAWIVFAQKSTSRSKKVNAVLIPLVTAAIISLAIFLFCEPDVECIVYGG